MLHLDTIARIKELSEAHGWSQYRLAKEANLPQTTVANIFHRGTTPSIATLEILCHAFHISLRDFFIEETADEPLLTAQSRTLLAYWNALNAKQQQAVMDLVRSMAEDRKAQ